MATVNYVKASAVSFDLQLADTIKWSLAANDVGQWLVLPRAADRSVHIYGTFGGATVVVEGTNEPEADGNVDANAKTLSDPQGNPLSFTAGPALKAPVEMVRSIRVRVIGGDGTTAITAVLLAKV